MCPMQASSMAIPLMTDDSEVDLLVNENPVTSSFNGGRILSNNGKISNVFTRTDNNLLEDLHFQQEKLESTYLQPLVMAIQCQSEIMKEVVERQKKIIRDLHRRGVSDHEDLCCT